MTDAFETRRNQMVESQIVGRGITDPDVVGAMRSVPRHRFVPAAVAAESYEDHPLPIGGSQTISQPYIVAAMTDFLGVGADDRVLEIGTGSGYGAAVLAELAAEVWTVERDADLAAGAAATLEALGVANVHVRCADGTLGWPDGAPYDAISVTAAGPEVPASLTGQLAADGRLVMPVGERSSGQHLVRVRRTATGLATERLTAVAFVPLVGEHGW